MPVLESLFDKVKDQQFYLKETTKSHFPVKFEQFLRRHILKNIM